MTTTDVAFLKFVGGRESRNRKRVSQARLATKETVRIKLPVISSYLSSNAMRNRRWRSLCSICLFHQSVLKTEVTINMKSSRAKFSDISFASGLSKKDRFHFTVTLCKCNADAIIYICFKQFYEKRIHKENYNWIK